MDTAAIVDIARAPRPAVQRWLAVYEREWRQRLWWNRNLIPGANGPPPEGRCLFVGGEVGGGYLRTGSNRAPILEGPHLVPEWRGRGWVSQLATDAARESSRRTTEVMTIAFDAEDAGPAFVAAGFGWLRREFRVRERSASPPPSASVRPRGQAPARLMPWPAGGGDLGALLHAAFLDTPDGQSSRLYRSPTRCALYLDRLVRGGEGALFATAISRIAVDESGRAIGLLVACSTAPRTVHVAQVAVLAEARGLGVGRLLMAHALEAGDQSGVRRLTLFNTASQGAAAAWYARLGFRVMLDAGWGWRAGRPASDGQR